MKRLLWIGGLGAALVFLYFTALPGDLAVGRDAETGIAGTYTVNGTDPTRAEYSGTAVIVETSDSAVFDVEWIITSAIQRGTGTLQGSTFSVDWEATASAGGGSGRSVYVVEADGRLVGERFIDGVDEPGPETLFPDP